MGKSRVMGWEEPSARSSTAGRVSQAKQWTERASLKQIMNTVQRNGQSYTLAAVYYIKFGVFTSIWDAHEEEKSRNKTN